MSRSTKVLAAALGLLPLAARAGDPQAHTAAMTQTAINVDHEAEFVHGVGAPKQNGVPGVGMFFVPTDGHIDCPFAVVKFDDGSCSYDSLSGRAINEPDDWKCSDKRMPPEMTSINSMQAPLQAIIANALVDSGASEAALACNYNHFNSNPKGPPGGDSTSAAAIALAWANTIPDTLADGGVPNADPAKAIQCNTATWLRYYARVANSLHYTQDSVCEDHKDGNLACQVDDTVPFFGTFFTFANAKGCHQFLSQAIDNITLGDGSTACDESVVSTATAPAGLTFTMSAVDSACEDGGLGLACMGLERTIRHHCSLPTAPKTLVCSGPPADHVNVTSKHQFCEGEIHSAFGGEDFFGKATNASVPILEVAARKWATVCKQPDDPCVPAQCDTWCKRSVAPMVDMGAGPQAFGGFCENASADAQCELHTCTCDLEAHCGGAGQACCKTGAACSDAANECGKATGTCVAKGSQSCSPFKVVINPAAQNLTVGLSATLTVALTNSGQPASPSGDSFYWTNSGNQGTLADPVSGAKGNALCVSGTSVTYQPLAAQTPGVTDELAVVAYSGPGCSRAMALAGASATITIKADNPYTIWKMTNIHASGTSPVPSGENLYVFEQEVVAKFQRDLASFQSAAAGTVESRLYSHAGTSLTIDLVPPSTPVTTTDNAEQTLAVGTTSTNNGTDDPNSYKLDYEYTGTGSANGTVTGEFYLSGGEVCLEVANYPNYKFNPSFTLSGQTGSGTVVYDYRVVENHCMKPGITYYEWQMTVSFDAVRLQ